MRRQLYVILTLLAVLLTPTATAKKGGEWNVSSVLKAVDKAVKDLRGAIAEADWEETLDGREVKGSGKLWINFAGKMRAEVAGSSPRTIVAAPPRLYIYRPLKNEVTEYNLTFDHDLLAQYALLGFAPAGTALKKDYKVRYVREDTLGDRKAHLLTLDPKSKEVAATIASLQLWVDSETWLPAQQLIRHKAGRLQVTVHYHEIVPKDDLPVTLFRPIWPKGTKLVKECRE